jgi:hypothetical protein
MAESEDKFCSQIMKLIAERQDFIAKGVSPGLSRQELLDQIPAPQNGRLQWPLKSDLDGLTDEQLHDFALTEF